MALALQNRVAVLTGAASGIGAALAPRLAAKGVHLALVDRNAEGLAKVAADSSSFGVQISTHVADLGEASAIAELPAAVEAAHGPASLLIANAGVALVGTFEQASLADFEWLMNINFWGPVRLTRAFLPQLRQAPAAQIVLTSSVFGLIGPPGQTAYAASKFALRGFGEALRHELAATGIGVTLVHPGGIATEIARNARIGAGMDPAAAQAGVSLFQKMLRTSPDTAALRMVAAIEQRRPRLLIGRDALQIDVIQRLLPAGYWRLMARGQRGLTPLTEAKGAKH
ncbi:MAG: acetoin dehydrogenase [Rhodospirillales bacterium 20-64-7]|nr:MAG: acetoin dehydrogenase [Rhodospirillales bacterium 20-64-7]